MLDTIFAACLATAAASPESAAPPTPRAAAAAPDMVPLGWRGVDVRRDVDSDVFRERCCVQYAVRKGDTLAAIAQRHLGGAQRALELIELNDGLEPTRLRIGQRIWLPPRDAKAPRRFVFLTATGLGFQPTGYAIGDRVYAKYSDYAFVVVDAAHVEQLQKTEGWDQIVAMQKEKKLQAATGTSVSPLVRNGSPVRRIVETIRVRCDQDGRYEVESSAQRFGADDKPIKKGAPLGERGEQWLLLLGLGGAGLVWRRRRAAAAA